jgi:hypothetical protein
VFDTLTSPAVLFLLAKRAFKIPIPIEQLSVAELGPNTARRARELALRAVRRISEFSEQLEELLPEAEESGERLAESGLSYLG